MNLRELAAFELEKGGHVSPADGLCAMEAVALLDGDEHSARPECACPVISAFVRRANDRLPDDVRQRLVPFLPKLVGTVAPGQEQARADWAVWQVFAVILPDLVSTAGAAELARSFRAVPIYDWEAALDAGTWAGSAMAEIDPTAARAIAWACEAVSWARSGAHEWAAAGAASAAVWSAQSMAADDAWDNVFRILDGLLTVGASAPDTEDTVTPVPAPA